MQKKVVVEKEGVKKDISFRKILLNRCQKEFEKEKSVEKRIHEKLEHLSKEGLTVSNIWYLLLLTYLLLFWYLLVNDFGSKDNFLIFWETKAFILGVKKMHFVGPKKWFKTESIRKSE